MATSPPTATGTEDEEGWLTASEDIEMRDPGSLTAKRTRDDQSPEEERGREVTRAIKQELIQEAGFTEVNREGKKPSERIDLTNTDEEMDSKKEADVERDDSSKE